MSVIRIVWIKVTHICHIIFRHCQCCHQHCRHHSIHHQISKFVLVAVVLFPPIFPIFLGFGFWVCLRFVFGPNVDDVVHVDLVIILKGLTLQQNLFSMGIKTPNTRIKVGGFLYFYRSGVVVVNYPTRWSLLFIFGFLATLVALHFTPVSK